MQLCTLYENRKKVVWWLTGLLIQLCGDDS